MIDNMKSVVEVNDAENGWRRMARILLYIFFGYMSPCLISTSEAVNLSGTMIFHYLAAIS